MSNIGIHRSGRLIHDGANSPRIGSQQMQRYKRPINRYASRSGQTRVQRTNTLQPQIESKNTEPPDIILGAYGKRYGLHRGGLGTKMGPAHDVRSPADAEMMLEVRQCARNGESQPSKRRTATGNSSECGCNSPWAIHS